MVPLGNSTGDLGIPNCIAPISADQEIRNPDDSTPYSVEAYLGRENALVDYWRASLHLCTSSIATPLEVSTTQVHGGGKRS